jgi:hypothetical protein
MKYFDSSDKAIRVVNDDIAPNYGEVGLFGPMDWFMKEIDFAD